MEDLKKMLDSNILSITDINNNVNQFIGSANGYSDKLKLTFVALHLLEKGSELLKSVKPDEFILQVKEKINEMEKEKETLFKAYGVHLEQNDEIIGVLTDKNNSEISNLQQKIQKLLSDYDGIIKELVKKRKELSLPEIKQKQ